MNEESRFTLRGRNPDILTCIANLSSDEVFTPPEFANRMLDTLAEAWAADHEGADIWASKSVRFLDPCTKSGVFLREIVRRLTKGLADEIPDLQERVDHILTNQVFGIGITRLTAMLARRSVYCSRNAQGLHSIAKRFADNDGNIWFDRTKHKWKNGKCEYCGASRATFSRGLEQETHAYAFIHAPNIKAWLARHFGNMQFDVIIGNPPYQLASDGGTRDVPIYQHFVENARLLAPKYLIMVIPSRWMATGLGLKDFRDSMLKDKRLCQIVDYERMDQVFPGVDFEGGVCYFLWNRSADGLCAVTTISGDEVVGPVERRLDEYEVLVRDSRSLEVLKKVLSLEEDSVTHILSADKEFGWTSNFTGFHSDRRPGDVALHYNRGGKRLVGWIDRRDVHKSPHLIEKWKLLVPKAYGERGARPAKVLGPCTIASAPSVCTQTFLFFYADTEAEIRSIYSYYQTKFFRFLVSLRKITQDASRSTYSWVPVQKWDREWTDEALYAKYGLSADERAMIESLVRPMDRDLFGDTSDA